MPLVGSLRGRDGTEFRPFASVIPDTVNHLSLLAGNDQIEGGAGQDTIIGDNYTSAVPLRSGIASLDQSLDSLTLSLYQLNYDLHDLELAQASRSGAAPQELTIGSDTINGGDDNDLIMGDNGQFLGPLTVKSPANAAAVNANLIDLQQIISNFSATVNNALAPFIATGAGAQPYTLAIGNDTINGNGGDDKILADDVLILNPVLKTLNYERGSFWNYAILLKLPPKQVAPTSATLI